MNHFKLKFRQSGGIAGLIRGCDIDSANLPEADANEIKSLLILIHNKSRNLASDRPNDTRDGFEYDLSISIDGKSTSYHFGANEVDESLRPLLKYLKLHSLPQKLE